MAQLTLTEIVAEVGDYVADHPLAKVARAANQVLRRIHRELGVISRTNFTTTPPYSTGTLTATQNSTTITGSGTSWQAGWKEALIRIDGDDTWYGVTFGSTTGGTLVSAFAGAGGAGLTYEICFPSILLPARVLEPIRIWRPNTEALKFASDEHRDELARLLDPGTPEFWSPAEMEHAADVDEVRIRLTPPPDDYLSYALAFRKKETLFDPSGAGAQKTLLPSYMNECIIYGTLFHVFDQVDKQDRSMYWRGLYENALRELFAQHTAHAASQMSDGDIGDSGMAQVFPVT